MNESRASLIEALKRPMPFEIAAAAGVALQTVQRWIDGQPIRPSSRRRIETAIARLMREIDEVDFDAMIDRAPLRQFAQGLARDARRLA